MKVCPVVDVGDTPVVEAMHDPMRAVTAPRRAERTYARKSRATSAVELLGLLALTTLAATLILGVLFAGLLLQLFSPGN